MEEHRSEEERRPNRSWPSWLVLVVLLSTLPGSIYTVLHPLLSKGFEVELSWMFLIATMLGVAILTWRLLKARPHDDPNKRRRLRILLGTLFVATAVVSAFSAYLDHSAVIQSAQNEFERVRANREAETATALEVCEESSHWLNTELREPFVNKKRAWAAHTHRLAVLLTSEQRRWVNTNWGDGGQAQLKTEDTIHRAYLDALKQLRETGGSNYADQVDKQIKISDPFSREIPSP